MHGDNVNISSNN